MAAEAWLVFGPAVENITDGNIDLDSDSFRMVLVTSSWTPSQSTNGTWSDLSANEASGTGYTANGQAITQSVTRSGNTVTFDCGDQSWASSTISAKYAVIVRDGDSNGALAAGDLLLCYSNLDDTGGSLSSSAGTFAVSINASGVFTVAA